MFLGVWICLSVDMASNTSYCSIRKSGFRYPAPRYTTACNTMYAAYAFALVEWILFTISFCYVSSIIIRELPSLPPIVEKDEIPRASKQSNGPGQVTEAV